MLDMVVWRRPIPAATALALVTVLSYGDEFTPEMRAWIRLAAYLVVVTIAVAVAIRHRCIGRYLGLRKAEPGLDR
jgi:hypothetical protein